MRETQELSPDMELPQGLGAAMARSPAAMERFAALPAEEQEALIRRARSAQSKQEMRACVDGLLQ
ncbi:MAG: hypothetical protein HFG01_07695 [Oscillibacter sp.]|jgi:uncharacterized protein YdeI (YjbR/CyaY-like superfamily)|nr:hypothetical protein [Oscillibacter sp.]